MTIIFSASTDAMSSEHTSRIIGPVLRWLNPQISDAAIERVQHVVRKGGHVTEYAVLAVFFWIGCRRPVRHDSRPWRWSEAGMALALAFLYAASDEFHQSFIPSRGSSFLDVMWDTGGAVLGLTLLWWLGGWRKQ